MKIATRSSLTLQCLSCGEPASISPQRTLRGFDAAVQAREEWYDHKSEVAHP